MSDKTVSALACAALADMVRFSEDLQAHANRLGALQLATRLMDMHSRGGEVSVHGGACKNAGPNRATIIHSGGVRLMVSALNDLPCNETFLYNAFLTFALLGNAKDTTYAPVYVLCVCAVLCVCVCVVFVRDYVLLCMCERAQV